MSLSLSYSLSFSMAIDSLTAFSKLFLLTLESLLTLPRDLALDLLPALLEERANGLLPAILFVPWLPAVAFIIGMNLLFGAEVPNLFTFVALKTAFCFEYLSRFFRVFCLISSTFDFSISSKSAHLSRLVFLE